MSVPNSADQSADQGYRLLQRRLGFKHPSRVSEEDAKAHPKWEELTAPERQHVLSFISRQLVPA